jgi:hypothetical protein
MLNKIISRFALLLRRSTSFFGLGVAAVVASLSLGGMALAQDATVPSKSPLTLATTSTSQSVTEPTIVVTGDELPSAYGAPGAFSRSRFSTLTNAYVLPAWGVFAGLIYEGDIFSDKPTKNKFTQEIEVGLPYRFGIAIENKIQNVDSETVNKNFSIEGRWALADWDKIPLNPTLFAEYKFGTTEGEPDSYEFKLLLSEEIVKGVGWAFNPFLENESSGDRGREWGFAQSVQMPFFLPHERFKAGVEMQYKNKTEKDSRGDPENSFVIGPSFSYKPTARMRFDVAPLFGVTEDSPDLEVFAIFSYVFGGQESEAEAPASMRNR